MPAYRYAATAADGRPRDGVVDADSPRQARARLRAQGLFPLAVELLDTGAEQRPGARAGELFPGLPRRRRLPRARLPEAVRQLACLLEAGLPLAQALTLLVEQETQAAARELFAELRADVVGGQSLAAALARHPHEFPDYLVAVVRAGEQSADLGGVLARLADFLEGRAALWQKVGAAFVYPAIVTLVALAVTLGLTTTVVPQVAAVFHNAQQQLPLPTRALIAASDLLRHWGLALLAALAVAAAAGLRLLQRPALRLRFDRRLLTLPLAGPLLAGADLARFAATLAVLGAGGVPLLRGLETAAASLANRRLRAAALAAVGRLREGATLAAALAAERCFPPLLVHLVASGEASGRLPEMLAHAARQIGQQTERRANALAQTVEPLLVLTMGALVLAIVLAILLPIIDINQVGLRPKG